MEIMSINRFVYDKFIPASPHHSTKAQKSPLYDLTFTLLATTPTKNKHVSMILMVLLVHYCMYAMVNCFPAGGTWLQVV